MPKSAPSRNVELAPVAAIVMASVVGSHVMAIPLPAVNVNVSAILSATALFPPVTVMLLNALIPDRPAPLPVMFPVIASPLELNTATFDVPATPTVTLPPELTTLTLDVPLDIEFKLIPVTPIVTVLLVLLPVIEMLSPALNEIVLPTELANTAVPLAFTLPNANAEFCSNISSLTPIVIGSLVVNFH